MAKIKCEYCGNYMLETDETCPSCGAVNPQHLRTANDTPKTIEELKQWYSARNLPPEETTRFFIGKDVEEPKAFGIYSDENGQFIVYKNKDDGERAIRYKGTDEAYAVNELYLKLKEAILVQKKINIQKRSGPSRSSKSFQKKAHSIRSSCLVSVIMSILAMTFFLILTSVIRHAAIDQSNYDRISQIYYTDGANLYYYAGRDSSNVPEWWIYSEGSWKKYGVLVAQNEYPVEEESIKEILLSEYRDEYDPDATDINKCREFIDSGHHKTSLQSYYNYNDTLYYFVSEGPTSGWYRYDSSYNDWEYYCSDNDHEKLGDDLWYDADSNYISSDSIYDYLSEEEWNVCAFEETQYYKEYDYYQEEQKNSSHDDSDNDSDYDYDSDYDWDDGDYWYDDWGDWGDDW